jgi:5-methyltetrahydrofolate--homocysteine methyltransferase
LEPLGELPFKQARDGFAEQAAALVEGGVDVLWIETMSDLKEVQAAAEGARLSGDTPLVITMTFDTNGYTMMGVSPVQALEAIQAYNPLAIGGNCGNGPGEIEGVIRAMKTVGLDIPLVAKSNAGIPVLVDGHPHYNASPQDMAAHAVSVRDMGATIIGGCCGNTAEHVRAMAQALATSPINLAAVQDFNGRKPAKGKRVRKHSRRRTVRRTG